MNRLLAKVLVLVLTAPAAGAAQDNLTIVRATPPANPASAENFTGTARVGEIFRGDDPARVHGATVAFEAGARTHWHAHALGQTLVVTSGTGLVQLWGGAVQEIRTGDVVLIPPGEKHWHGASTNAPMTHVAIAEAREGAPSIEWMEAVSDDQYAAGAPPAPAESATSDEEPSRAQQLMGDIAPQLADLTDDVLYGQVWPNPDLSPRDRSLVTVSALIALNRPDQLRSHLGIARRNGLTQEEAIAAITHLAFYAGWPNAVTAVSVAREVFQEP